MRLIGGTFALLPFMTFALLSLVAARTVVAEPTLEITPPQGCGPGVTIGPSVQIIVRATGIAAGGVVSVQITEANAFNQKFTDSTSLANARPERTLTKPSDSPFPAGNLLITAKFVGQTTVVHRLADLDEPSDGGADSDAQSDSDTDRKRCSRTGWRCEL